MTYDQICRQAVLQEALLYTSYEAGHLLLCHSRSGNSLLFFGVAGVTD